MQAKESDENCGNRECSGWRCTAIRPIDADRIPYYEDEQGYEIAYKIHIDAMPALPQPGNEPLTGWVSVDERLPEDDPTIKKHIEMDKFGFLTVLVYNGTIKQTNRFFCNAPHFGLPKTDGWEWASMNVTHWMPLPAPPDCRPPEGEEDT